MKILGLDLSTKCSGYGVFEDNKLLSHGVIDLSKNKDTEERSKQMMLEIGKLINKEKPDFLICEETWCQRNVDTTKTLSYLIGATLYQCYLNNIKCEKILPSSWRAKVGLSQGKKKRTELKQEAIKMVKDLYQFDPIEDEAEAILIGLSKVYNNVSEELFE